MFVYFLISLYKRKELSMILAKLCIPFWNFSSFICKKKKKTQSNILFVSERWPLNSTEKRDHKTIRSGTHGGVVVRRLTSDIIP